jgi:hypothetical protein
MLLGYGKCPSIDALCVSFQSECHKVPIQHRFASNQVPSWHSILAVLYLLQQRKMSLAWLLESARHAICQEILRHLARELMLKHRSTLQRKKLLGRRGICVWPHSLVKCVGGIAENCCGHQQLKLKIASGTNSAAIDSQIHLHWVNNFEININ